MSKGEKKCAMLSPYRALDLAGEMGLLCGKVLGDLGVDVIKVEKPDGDDARKLGPFYHDTPGPENSLLWWAYNTSKRGVTLDLEDTQGRQLFKKLVMETDFVIESFPPGYMADLGIGYADLEELNPGVIMISISPFGQTGPYRSFKTSDIVSFAMGGRMYVTGDHDRPPVRIGHHSQSYLNAGAEGAVGAMLALYHRQQTGKGQHVDVSVQASVAVTLQIMALWDAVKFVPRRQRHWPHISPPEELPETPKDDTGLLKIWPCKDGHVVFFFWTGEVAQRWNPLFFEWVGSEGVDVERMKDFDWVNWNSLEDAENTAFIAKTTSEFFLSRTRKELLEGAVKHHVMLSPLATTEDIVENPQLIYRGFWVELSHGDRGMFTYPGAYAKLTEAPPVLSRRAPTIGEHNQEIFGDILGLSEDEIRQLQKDGVI